MIRNRVVPLVSCLFALIGAPQAMSAQGGRIYLHPVSGGARDSVTQLQLMLTPPGGNQLASFHVAVTYDTAVVQSVRVNPHGGLQVANTTVAGAVALAGVEPRGFAPGLLATLVVRKVPGKALGDIGLRALELNDPAGKSLVSSVAVDGLGARRAPGIRIDSITPGEGKVSRDEVLEVVIHGHGFARSGNTVFFGDMAAAVVPSEQEGQRIRFIAPYVLHAKDAGKEVLVAAGTWSVQVGHAEARSNRLTFTVRGNIP